jgi:cell division protease FtsH
VLLGGRTAELIVFGDMSTGGQNDLLRATDTARAMVTEYGMSEAVGPVNHEPRGRSAFLETPFAPERGVYAEETARVIDAEVKRLIDDAETTARHILTEQRQPLDALTELLLEREVIEGDQLRELLIGPPPLPPGAFEVATEAAASGAAPPA